jgi:hypothetical protein
MLGEHPKYTLADLRGRNAWVTLRDVLDAHEAMDLEAAMAERAVEK